MKWPEEVTLSREEGEALIERIERNALSAEDRRVLGEGADLLLLAAVCAAGSEAESQAFQGAGVWREAQEAQAAVGGRDSERGESRTGREGRRTPHTEGMSTAAASPTERKQRPARAWAARGGGVSGGADGRVSA